MVLPANGGLKSNWTRPAPMVLITASFPSISTRIAYCDQFGLIGFALFVEFLFFGYVFNGGVEDLACLFHLSHVVDEYEIAFFKWHLGHLVKRIVLSCD